MLRRTHHRNRNYNNNNTNSYNNDYNNNSNSNSNNNNNKYYRNKRTYRTKRRRVVTNRDYRFLPTDHRKRLKSLMKRNTNFNSNLLESEENDTWNSVAMQNNIEEGLMCVNRDKSDCPTPECNWDKTQCVPSIIYSETNCYGKKHAECIGDCKWHGNVHNGTCHAQFGTMSELKLQHELINKELKTFSAFVKLLQNKNRSLVFHIRNKINDINKKLGVLFEKKRKFKKDIVKIKDQNKLNTRLNTFKTTTGDLVLLQNEKKELNDILLSIKYIANDTKKKPRRSLYKRY